MPQNGGRVHQRWVLVLNLGQSNVGFVHHLGWTDARFPSKPIAEKTKLFLVIRCNCRQLQPPEHGDWRTSFPGGFLEFFFLRASDSA